VAICDQQSSSLPNVFLLNTTGSVLSSASVHFPADGNASQWLAAMVVDFGGYGTTSSRKIILTRRRNGSSGNGPRAAVLSLLPSSYTLQHDGFEEFDSMGGGVDAGEADWLSVCAGRWLARNLSLGTGASVDTDTEELLAHQPWLRCPDPDPDRARLGARRAVSR